MNLSQTYECGNWDETAQFPEKEYINGIFLLVHALVSDDAGIEPRTGIGRQML
jgi:hypothetical protein